MLFIFEPSEAELNAYTALGWSIVSMNALPHHSGRLVLFERPASTLNAD
jgi:hypothetical protein